MRRAGHVACMGEFRNTYKILVGKPEEKRLLRRFKDNIREGLRETVVWIHLAQDRD
jgi:hypothetical protein